MIILKFNSEIESKVCYNAPILYGDPQYDKKKIFSYSVYESRIIKEIIFGENRVIKYHFDIYDDLSRIEYFNSFGESIHAINIEKLEEDNNLLKFREFLFYEETGNIGILTKTDNEKFNLSFHRVESLLGHKVSASFFGNDISLFKEVQFFKEKTGTLILDKVYINEYEMKFNFLENLAKKILNDGWELSDLDLLKLGEY